ncbi:hypothetical protein SPI_02177 [Niveomyces insectorum RCEF 264]|uniref:Cyclase n=1 Tax=Niveomyces insectorum RCEF 264 TaxID=1081102 RepID=A0A162MQS2_9HYPO|nr:hypothetical protein SPI_02177 [Niveomyces insectorum RCEF 264]
MAFKSGPYSDLPTFAELVEKTKGHPLEGHAWDVWNKPGQEKDTLGALNLLTPETVLKAKDEIQTGIRVQVDWPLNALTWTLHKRAPLKQQIVDLMSINDMYCHDDVLTFNTQASSQWDGFGHCGEQETGIYYNGVPHDQIMKTGNKQLGTDHWVKNGGIAGRGVLLDYVHYCEAHGKPVPYAHSNHGITVDDLEAIAAFEGVEFRTGDILFIRSGFTRWYDNAPEDERKEAFTGQSRFIGIVSDRTSRDWLWNRHFAAVAGDTFAFELRPKDTSTGILLHEWLLPRWGMPIGEMFNLEPLAQVCEEQKRWTFFFTSAPCYVPGGVATPPNGIAIL